MKIKFKKRIVAIAALVVILLLSIVTAAVPSADIKRKETEFLTELSSLNWVGEDAYSDGVDIKDITLNSVPQNGSFEFKYGDTLSFNIPADINGEYLIGFNYGVKNLNPTDLLFDLTYGNKNYIANLPALWCDSVLPDKRYPTDRFGNEMANTQVNYSYSVFNPLIDNRTVEAKPLALKLAGGNVTVKNTTQNITVNSIRIYRKKTCLSYEDYLKKHPSEDRATESIIVEGEDYSIKSDSLIRSSNINDISLHPYNTYDRLINNLDGGSFDTAGQKVMWEFYTPKSGWYNLGLHFCQNSGVNLKAYRTLEIDGVVPFAEMESLAFNQTGNMEFENTVLKTDKGDNYRFYLTEGKHTLGLTVTIEPYLEAYNSLKALTDKMNALGTDISKLTAGTQDKNRTWDIDTYLPNAVSDINGYIKELERIYNELEKISGDEPTYADGLKVAKGLLEKLLKKPRKIPNKTELFNSGDNSALKHINSVISKLTCSQLGIDRIIITPDKTEIKGKNISLFTSLKNSAKRFIYSMTPEAGGSAYGISDNSENLQVWMSRSSVYVQVLQNMVDSADELKGMNIDISIMPNEQKLVLAAAAGTGPDLTLGVSTATPFKFAIRGAAKDLTEYPDFLEFYNSQYNIEALIPCVYDGGVYGAVETQDFNVLFYRKDILDSLDIKVPDTWDDVKAVMPTLLRYNKNMSLPISNIVGYKNFAVTSPYIYQNGGEYYGDDGATVAFMELETINGFKEMTELFKIYAVEEYVASFYNSFRTGDTPIGISGVSTFVQLSEAAPELSGLWDIAPAPGTRLSDGSVVRHMNAATTTAMIFKSTDKPNEAWKFLKWWLSKETQTGFANTMERSYGSEYRWNTANFKAFEQGSYTSEQKKVILEMWKSQKETLQHPAGYIVEREISNAYTNVVVNGDTVIEALEKSTLVSNREIMRKLKEFGYCDDEGNLRKEYPIEVRNDLYKKLKEQSAGEGK